MGRVGDKNKKKEYMRKYCIEHKEHRKQYWKKYYPSHLQERKEYNKQLYLLNKQDKEWVAKTKENWKNWAERNKEKRTEYFKQYRLKNIINRKEYDRKRYLILKQDENWKKRKIEYVKNWNEKHKEKRKEYIREYRTKNKEKIQNYFKSEKWKKVRKAYNERRKQLRHELGISKKYIGEVDIFKRKENKRLNNKAYRIRYRNAGYLSVKIIQLVYEDNIKKFGTLTCYLCLKPISFGKDHLEHKIPLSRNGTNEYNNLAIACQKCNFKKHTKTEEEYRKENLSIWA